MKMFKEKVGLHLIQLLALVLAFYNTKCENDFLIIFFVIVFLVMTFLLLMLNKAAIKDLKVILISDNREYLIRKERKYINDHYLYKKKSLKVINPNDFVETNGEILNDGYDCIFIDDESEIKQIIENIIKDRRI
jgi:hypothetical protein